MLDRLGWKKENLKKKRNWTASFGDRLPFKERNRPVGLG